MRRAGPGGIHLAHLWSPLMAAKSSRCSLTVMEGQSTSNCRQCSSSRPEPGSALATKVHSGPAVHPRALGSHQARSSTKKGPARPSSICFAHKTMQGRWQYGGRWQGRLERATGPCEPPKHAPKAGEGESGSPAGRRPGCGGWQRSGPVSLPAWRPLTRKLGLIHLQPRLTMCAARRPAGRAHAMQQICQRRHAGP